MAKARCKNESCDAFEVAVDINPSFFAYDYKRELMICKACGHKLKFDEIKESAPTVYVNRFSSKSPEEKQKILKKRSHEHYEKYIKTGRLGGSYQ